MPVDKCPDCGKVISLRFPIHECVIPVEYPKSKETSMFTDEAKDLILCITRSKDCHIGDCAKCGWNT